LLNYLASWTKRSWTSMAQHHFSTQLHNDLKPYDVLKL
jgi:hypothetical protein